LVVLNGFLDKALGATKSHGGNISTNKIGKLLNKPQCMKCPDFADQCKVTQKLVKLTIQPEAFLESTNE